MPDTPDRVTIAGVPLGHRVSSASARGRPEQALHDHAGAPPRSVADDA